MFTDGVEGWDDYDWGWKDESSEVNADNKSAEQLSWLQDCLLSLSPSGDLIALANLNRVVLLSRTCGAYIYEFYLLSTTYSSHCVWSVIALCLCSRSQRNQIDGRRQYASMTTSITQNFGFRFRSDPPSVHFIHLYSLPDFMDFIIM